GASRIELEDGFEPGFEASIVEVAVRGRAAAAKIERLQIKHGEARGGLRLAEARQPQRGRRGRRGQLAGGGRGGMARGAQGDLRGECRGEQKAKPDRHDRERAGVGAHALLRWKSNRPTATSATSFGSDASASGPAAIARMVSTERPSR